MSSAPNMVSAKLLYNPAAGRGRANRQRVVEQVTSALVTQGFDVDAEPTYARGSGARQARKAIQEGAAVVFACGGDGTVHDVLQGTAGTNANLGLLPAGSANALAQELRISSNPVRAAQSFQPGVFRELRNTSVQRSGHPTLYSLCMAGAGPDGLLMYRMLAVDRAGFGRWRYYEHALRVFLSHRFAPFRIQVQHLDGTLTEHRTASAMALRVGDLQGIFRGIARGASVLDDSLHVILVAPPARFTFPTWFLAAWLGLDRFHPGVTVSKAASLRSNGEVPLQVDGEWAGRVAVTITMDGPLQRVLTPRGTSLEQR